MEYDEECVLPDEPVQEGLYVVYYDDGLLPQVHELPSDATVADMWIAVDYLVGEDLDPVTVFRDTGINFEIFAYRRCGEDGKPYQDGWIGSEGVVPDEYLETAPAKPKRRSRGPGVEIVLADHAYGARRQSAMYEDIIEKFYGHGRWDRMGEPPQ